RAGGHVGRLRRRAGPPGVLPSGGHRRVLTIEGGRARVAARARFFHRRRGGRLTLSLRRASWCDRPLLLPAPSEQSPALAWRAPYSALTAPRTTAAQTGSTPGSTRAPSPSAKSRARVR